MRQSGSTRAFTLLEMLIAIVIFTLISVYLYKSLATLNSTNRFYGEKLRSISHDHKILKTIYLDLSLAVIRSVFIVSQDEHFDVILMQTKHSVHRRTMPYVAYLVLENKFYRIESSQQLSYPFNEDQEMIVDELGEMEHFRLYSSKTHFLLDYEPKDEDPQLMKIRGLNY